MAVILELDGDVQKILGKLNQTKQGLTDLKSEYDDLKTTSQTAINGSASAFDTLSAKTKTASKDIQGQTSIYDNLEKYLKRVIELQKQSTNANGIEAYNTEIAKATFAMNSLANATDKSFKGIEGFVNTAKGAFQSLSGVVSKALLPLIALDTLKNGVIEVVKSVNDYEQSSADLSAITGATGKDLEFLQQSAIKTGLTTTASAVQTLEAYKLIASAKPELLDNAAALTAITNEAIVLSDAIGQDLPQTATQLTGIMNQFGASADEASRYVNALAAGSKFGSVEGKDLAASYETAGTALALSNVKFEESVGLLETLGEKSIKGAEAGTALRNVANKLTAIDLLPKDALERLNNAGVNTQILSDKTLTFTQRLTALKPIQNDANALVAVFGDENSGAAKILIDNVAQAEKLTKAVTGTNVANEQAAIRTKTVNAEFTKLKNTFFALIQGEGGGLSGLLAATIAFTRDGLLFLKQGFDLIAPQFERIFNAIGSLIAPIFAVSEGTKEAANSTSIFTKVLEFIAGAVSLVAGYFETLSFGVQGLTSFFGGLINQSSGLKSFFGGVVGYANGLLDVFLNLPSYIAGGYAAIKAFVVETGNGIGRLGQNIGNVLFEAFNLKKLISEGSGGLEAAVAKALTNPFDGVGEKVSKAFSDEFNRTKVKPIVVPIKTQTATANAPKAAQTVTANAPKKKEENDKKAAKSDKTAAKSDKKADQAAKDAKTLADQAEKDAKAQKERDADIAKTKLEVMKAGVEKELLLEQIRFDDLIKKLKDYNIDTESTIEQHEQNKFAIKQKYVLENANADALSGQERINFVFDQNKKEIDALENALKGQNGDLNLDQQKQIALLRKKVNEQFLSDSEAFYNEDFTKNQEHDINLLELARDSFKTQKEFEDFKEREILDIRLTYAEQQLKIVESLKGADSDAALLLRKNINAIKGEIGELSKINTNGETFNIYKLLGLDPESEKDAAKIKGIETFAQGALDVLDQVQQARLETANAAIEASDKEIAAIDAQIEAKESQLEKEKELASQGFANNQNGIRAEIDLLRQQSELEKTERQKALDEKIKIQKQQAAVDTVTQGSSLITASANIFSSVSAIPFVGVGLAIGLIAAMLAAFTAAKVRVFKSISTQTAERGMSGVVKGRRHSEGGEKFGDHIEVEDGEPFGILSRKAAVRFGKPFIAFVNAANKGDFSGVQKAFANMGVVRKDISADLTLKEAQLNQINVSFNKNETDKEGVKTNDLLQKMLKTQNKEVRITYSKNAKIVQKGNVVTIVKKVS